MEGELVPFELALKLKEKGYPQDFGRRKSIFAPSYRFYNSKGLVDGAVDEDALVAYASAPLIFQVLKWLREEKNVYIQIEIAGRGYACSLYGRKWFDSYLISEIHNRFHTYEEAALAGIEYTLDHLI